MVGTREQKSDEVVNFLNRVTSRVQMSWAQENFNEFPEQKFL